MTKEDLKSLSYEELLELYKYYSIMGKNAMSHDINIGMGILDIANDIEIEINQRDRLNDIKKKELKK